MAKFGSTGGGGAGGMSVPVARPAGHGPGTGGPAGGGFMDTLRGIFPQPQGGQQQHDMIMQLVQAGMGSAQNANSPLLSLLAPMVGSAIGARAGNKLQEGNSARAEEQTSALLGDLANDPKMQGYLAILNDPNSPAHLRTVAEAGLKRATTPAATVKPWQASNTDALIARFAQAAMDPEGPGGSTVTPEEQTKLDTVRNARLRTNQGTSGLSVVDELTGLATGNTSGGGVDQNDPLGILNIPPA